MTRTLYVGNIGVRQGVVILWTAYATVKPNSPDRRAAMWRLEPTDWLVRIQLEAALAIGKIRQKGLKKAQPRDHLAKLADDARSKSFELIARKASAAAALRVVG